MLFENSWKHSWGSFSSSTICPKEAGFSAFLGRGKSKLVMGKKLNFCVNPGDAVEKEDNKFPQTLVTQEQLQCKS